MPRSKNAAPAAVDDGPVTLTMPRRLLAALYEAAKHGVIHDSFPAGQEKAGRELVAYLGARFPELIAADKGRQP